MKTLKIKDIKGIFKDKYERAKQLKDEVDALWILADNLPDTEQGNIKYEGFVEKIEGKDREILVDLYSTQIIVDEINKLESIPSDSTLNNTKMFMSEELYRACVEHDTNILKLKEIYSDQHIDYSVGMRLMDTGLNQNKDINDINEIIIEEHEPVKRDSISSLNT